jgi:phosphoglycerate dehydrogenase-like enzyme
MEKIVVNANNDHERQTLKKLVDDFPEYKIVFPANKDDLLKELADADILAGYFINKEMLDVANNLNIFAVFWQG